MNTLISQLELFEKLTQRLLSKTGSESFFFPFFFADVDVDEGNTMCARGKTQCLICATVVETACSGGLARQLCLLPLPPTTFSYPCNPSREIQTINLRRE